MSGTAKDAILSPEAQAVVADKALVGKRKLKQWMPLLAELEAYDVWNEKRCSRMKGFGILGIVLGVIGAIASVAAFGPKDKMTMVVIGVAIGAVLVLAGIVMFIIRSQWMKNDLTDDLRKVVVPLFKEFEEDIDPDRKIAIDMEVCDPVIAKAIVGKERLGGYRGKMILTTFQKNPTKITVPLANGASIGLMMDRVLERYDNSYTTRSRSGKMKFKRKRKWKVTLSVSTTFIPADSQLEWDPKALSKLSSRATVKQKTKNEDELLTLVQKYKYKAVTDQPDSTPPLKDIVKMFIQLSAAARPTA